MLRFIYYSAQLLTVLTVLFMIPFDMFSDARLFENRMHLILLVFILLNQINNRAREKENERIKQELGKVIKKAFQNAENNSRVTTTIENGRS